MSFPRAQSFRASVRKLATTGVAVCIGSGVLVGALATEVSAATVTISGAATNAPNQSCVYIESPVTGDVVANTTTGGNGAFSSSVPSGHYLVQIDPSCFGDNSFATVAGAYYDAGATNNATSVFASATAVDATGGSVSGIDLTLLPGATFSGTVDSGAGGTASGVCVYLFNGTDGWAYQGKSTSGGGYSLTGIAPDAANGYELEFDPSCGGTVSSTLAPTFWQNETVEEADTPVFIEANQNFGTVTVPVGGTISGTVTQPNGAAGPSVCVLVASTDNALSYVYEQRTGASGTYSFTGLAATTFDVFYDPGCNSSQSTDFGEAQIGSALSISPGITRTVSGTLAYSGSPLAISPTTATTGTVGSAFSQGFSTTGGIAPFAWSATNLPAGLSISASTGVVTGTPTTSGSGTVTISATDSSAEAVAISQSVTFNINPAPAPAPPNTTPTPPTTPTPKPSVPPAPTPKVTVTSSIVLKNGTAASIPVSCAAATCSGTVKLVEKTTSKVPYKKKVGKKTVTAYKTKTVITVLGTASFKLNKGKKATETLVLNATGKRVVGRATAKKTFHEFLETTVKGGATTIRAAVVS